MSDGRLSARTEGEEVEIRPGATVQVRLTLTGIE
jgi:hypothetical protein